jgi:hypothetical protein
MHGIGLSRLSQGIVHSETTPTKKPLKCPAGLLYFAVMKFKKLMLVQHFLNFDY